MDPNEFQNLVTQAQAEAAQPELQVSIDSEVISSRTLKRSHLMLTA